MSGKNKHWRKVSTREIYKTNFFRFRAETLELPDNRIMPNYYIMDFSDWVNVVALTKDNQVILIRQFRPPVETTTLEIPGGSTDPRNGEVPEQAAIRELEEETGYVPQEVRLLGWHSPNPALQSNRLWTFLATGCERTKQQNLDEFEDIDVLVKPVKEMIEDTRNGNINHSLIIASIHLAMPYLEKLI